MAYAFDNIDLMQVATLATQETNNLLNKLRGDGTNNEKLIQSTISRLKLFQKRVEKEEKETLQKIGCSSLKELNARLAEFYSGSNYDQFIGINIRDILKGYRQNKDLVRKFQTILNYALQQFINKDVIQEYQKGHPETNHSVQAAVGAILNAQLTALSVGAKAGASGIQMKGLTKSTGFVQTNALDNEVLGVAATEITDIMRRNLRDIVNYIDAGTGNDPELNALANYVKQNFNKTIIKTSNKQVELGLQWSAITEQLRETEAKQLSKADLNNRNYQIMSLILKQLSSEYRTIAALVIKTMLIANPTMFFVGEATTQLTGIMGEIAAVHAIINLLGPKYTPQAVQWVATHKASGKSLSVDIVLRDIGGVDIGIQVKNTSKDLEESLLAINFADKETTSLFQNLGLPNTANSAFTDAYTALSFNVPYQFIIKDKSNKVEAEEISGTPQYSGVQSEFKLYQETYEKIQKATEAINMYMVQYAPQLLYMSLGKGMTNKIATLDANLSKTLGGNTIYIVGRTAHGGSEMLGEISEAIKKLEDLIHPASAYRALDQDNLIKFDSYIKKMNKGKTTVNIVHFMNNYFGKISAQQAYGNRTYLRTSYNFGRR